MPGKVTRTVRKSDVFRYEQAGAGGWGDPLKRDPARVLADVRNEFVSTKMARMEYGVVIDTETWTVDEQQTRQLRQRMAVRQKTVLSIDRGILPRGLRVEGSVG